MDSPISKRKVIFKTPEAARAWAKKFAASLKPDDCIALIGPLGAGKTTLTEMLSKHYRWIPQFEDVDHNPYLMDFYEDMPRWSFNLQIFFLI